MPRPYDCVKRAWHSDQHQPIRGSIIQEIFRLATEVHSIKTRRNKEWQEKLPFVVLRAEEIMYSKANSEAEYIDFNTLCVRVNDAVDTIIRKDDSTETEDLLKPCIEAALNLGCVPQRASRSQRHNNPRCYLKEYLDASTCSPIPPDGKLRPQKLGVPFHLHLPFSSVDNLQNSRHFAAWYLSPSRPVAANGGSSGPRTVASFQDNKDFIPVSDSELSIPSLRNLQSDQNKQLNSPQSCPFSSTGRVYPLYYLGNHQNPKLQLPLRYPAGLNCNSTVDACSSPGFQARENEIDHWQHEFFSLPSSDANSYQGKGLRPNVRPVYDLIDCSDVQNHMSPMPILTSPRLNCNPARANGFSVLLTMHGKAGSSPNYSAVNNTNVATNVTSMLENSCGTVPDFGCDLSLRLGPSSSSPKFHGKSSRYREMKFGDSGNSSPSSLSCIRC